jgi:CO/xanthine dehydrogenase FAD-binding subunit
MGVYLRPRRLEEALSALARPHTVLAGGTDFYPARVGRAIDEDVLDIGGIDVLRGITAGPAGWRLGATTTWSELLETDLPPLFDGLKQAAREVGGRQIQNAGTLAGNICNASPAADGVPGLLALDAEVEIAGPTNRRLPLRQFITGVRRTALAPGELVVAIHVARPRQDAESAFLKLGARRYLVISIAMAAATVEFAEGRVAAARVAVGACSPVAERLPALEAALVGASRDRLADLVDAAQLAPLAPIDDVRGSATYRRDAVVTLLRRLLARFAR